VAGDHRDHLDGVPVEVGELACPLQCLGLVGEVLAVGLPGVGWFAQKV
jgi:hypothetical protein